jgi:hypothetical protein
VFENNLIEEDPNELLDPYTVPPEGDVTFGEAQSVVRQLCAHFPLVAVLCHAASTMFFLLVVACCRSVDSCWSLVVTQSSTLRLCTSLPTNFMASEHFH